MKTFKWATLFTALAFVAASFIIEDKRDDRFVKEESTKIEFIDDWNLAIELAKKEKKLIYLDAMASWCGPCKLMDKKTFHNPEVAKFFNKNFINVKMDMEKNDAGERLMKEFEIVAYPTSLFIDHKEKVVRKELGFLQPEPFLKLGQDVAKDN